MTDFERKTLDRLRELYMNGQLSDDFMVSNLKLTADYSNLKRLKDYADTHNLSIPGVKKCRNAFRLAGYYVITDPN